MIKRILTVAALGGLFALPACTSNQAGVEPARTIAPTAQSQLQFQVGTANYNGTTFLNTVVTFRQPNGLSALLDNTPSIAIPFTNTATSVVGACPNCTIFAGNDTGTNQISGTVQTANGVISPDPRTFPQTVGAFAYGFLASNSATTGANNSTFYPSQGGVVTNPDGSLSPAFQTWRMPIYGTVAGFTQRAFYVGPPNAIVGNSLPVTGSATFVGYPSGFTPFAIHPTAGAYVLTVGIPNSSTPVGTFTSTTNLTSLATLPAMPAPTFVSTGLAGGGSFTITVPAGITEAAIFFRELTPAGGIVAYHTLITHATGAQVLTYPSGTITPGDSISTVLIGFDYPAMEAVPVSAAPPQAPVINNSGTACTFSGQSSTCGGQADISLSPAVTFTQ